MASLGGMLAPVAMRVLRQALGSTANIGKVLRNKLGSAARSANTQLQPVAVRQPLHPFAFVRQQKQRVRWHSTLRGPHEAFRTALRRFLNGSRSAAVRPSAGQTARAVFGLTGRAPFATSLRPNLTGGALPRTAGGYAAPGAGGRLGGARYFSHAPASQAHVVQNVGQAMRAFWLSGQRARFDGCGPNGEKRYRVVSATHDDAARKLAAATLAVRRVPGSFVDFSVSPTITALSPLAAAFPFAMCGVGREDSYATAPAGPTLNEDGLLDLLSEDFERSLKDLSAVLADLKRLAGLGDLPILLENNRTIRVRFPGVDAETVTRLCDDLGVQRGVVGQDADFDEEPDVSMALRFPFAPDKHSSVKLSSPGGSLRSHQSGSSSDIDDVFVDTFLDAFLEENSCLSSAHSDEEEGYFTSVSPSSPGLPPTQRQQHAEDFEGVESIYRFVQECDRAAGRP
ncbi:hypothetical protein RB595_000596 [Gaeumannomyces hyphopodioides]